MSKHGLPALPAARIDFSGGVPRSLDYGDVYHSAMGAREQACHVFLSGNGLPQRWRGRRHFAILETGFGLGHNFLATWAAWRADPDRCQNLHFVSLERHPPSREDLARAHTKRPSTPNDDALSHQPSDPPPDPPPDLMAQVLIDAWPPLLTGLHALELQAPDLAPVRLTLALGDARRVLPQLVGNFDAFFLDGFAPWANPEFWDPRLLRALGRLAAPGSTAATWSVARTVRDGLKSAGFEVERAPGFGTKRQMSVARFAPRAPHRAPAGRPQAPWASERRAVVIGAGLAGACAAQALARQGWQCTVLDAAHAPASGASGNPAGLFHGVVHRDDGVHARLHRHAALGAARYYAELLREGTVPGRLDGLLAVRGAPQTRPHAGLGSLPRAPDQDFPELPGYVHGLSQEQASQAAAAPLGGAALHFVQGGWVDPGAVVRQALATPGVQFRGGAAVAALQAAGEHDPCWKVLDAEGAEWARAPLVVLAAGAGLPVLARAGEAPVNGLGPLEVTRGQLTWFASQAALARPVSGHGYAVSLPDGRLLCGASLRPDDEDPGLAEEDQRWNLERLHWLTGLAPAAGAQLGGRVSWRLQTPDRLPFIGPVPKTDVTSSSRQDQVRFMDRQPGLYVIGALGSRGLIWAPLAAQLLCAWVEATPMPLEAELLDALDPARWLVRQARRTRQDGT